MNASRSLFALLLCSLSLPLVACASPAADGDDDATQDDEIKKKVKPKGGNGAFDLLAPTSFKTDGFLNGFSFDGAAIKPGERREKVPGTYALRTAFPPSSDATMLPQLLNVTLTAGAVTQHQLGGLRVRFDQPLTLGSARVNLIVDGVGTGALEGLRAWQTTPGGFAMLVLAGTIGVTPNTDGVRHDVVIKQGDLGEAVLPIAKVQVQLDAYDPAYPTPSGGGCTPTFVMAGTNFQYDNRQSAYVRNTDGSPHGSFVVPQGVYAPVVLNAYGVAITQPTVAGGTNSFTLNRLEIDDVEVAQAGGGTTMVKGTVSISHKNPDGTYTALNCNFPTHSGVDLPDGDYQVVSRATSPSGTVTSTENVSFP
ncbi:MAG: hypothetical protein JWP97_504 [Labilithrix sp.]|nr:hypothetical protein [Labilithrix sp.]